MLCVFERRRTMLPIKDKTALLFLLYKYGVQKELLSSGKEQYVEETINRTDYFYPDDSKCRHQ